MWRQAVKRFAIPIQVNISIWYIFCTESSETRRLCTNSSLSSERVKNVVTSKGIQVGIECKWVKWREVNWRDICEVILFWSELIYTEVLRDKSNMHIRVTLYWAYLIVLWLFYLMCILHCGCFVMCECVYVWVL